MIEFKTTSLEDFQRKKLLRSGFVQEDENTFVRVTDNVRETWKRVDDGWCTSVDILAGILVLDDPEGLLP